MLLRLIDGTGKNSIQRLDNVNQTHLALACGKVALQKNPARSSPKNYQHVSETLSYIRWIHWIIFDFEKAKQDQVFFPYTPKKARWRLLKKKMNESLESNFGSKKIFFWRELKIWTKIKNPSEMSLSCKWRSCPPTLSDLEAVGNYGWDRERSPLDLFAER